MNAAVTALSIFLNFYHADVVARDIMDAIPTIGINREWPVAASSVKVGQQSSRLQQGASYMSCKPGLHRSYIGHLLSGHLHRFPQHYESSHRASFESLVHGMY